MPAPTDDAFSAEPRGTLELLASLADHLPRPVLLVNADLRVTRANLAARARFGPAATPGASLHDLPDLPDALLRACQAAHHDRQERDVPGPLEESLVRVVPVYADGRSEVTLVFGHVAPPEETGVRTLQDVTSALAGALSSDDVKRVVLEQAVRATGAYGGTLIQVFDATTLFMVGSIGYSADVELTWRQFPSGGRFPVVHAIREAEAVFATRAALDEHFPDLVPHLRPETRAVAAIPLVAGGQVLAGLTLSFDDERRILPERQAFMRTLVAQCAQALERARLYDAEALARRRATLLSEASATLSSSLDVHQTLDHVTRLMIRHVGDRAAVYLPDATGRMQVVHVAHQDPEREALLRRFVETFPSDPSTPGTSAWVYATQQPYLLSAVPTTMIDAIDDPVRREAVRALGLHSLLLVPLVAHGRTLGVLGMASGSPARTLGQDDLVLARELASRAALALDNAQLHERARHGEERYRSLVDATRQTVWTNTADGEMHGEQPGWAHLTGQTPDAYTGTGWADALHPDDVDATLHAWRHAVRTRSTFDVQQRVRVRDGTYRTFQVRGVPVLNDDGSIREWVGVHTDITEQVEAERALRELNATLEARVRERTRQLEHSERRFRSIFDSQFQFIGLLQPDGTLLEANRAALDFAGLRLEDVLGRPFWEAHWWQTSEETRQELRAAIARAAAGETVQYEVEVLGAGALTATIDFSLKPVRDEDGAVILLIPEGRVISEERRNAAVLQAVVSGAPLILFALDRHGTYVISAGAALTKLGREPNELVGRNVYDVYRDAPDVLEPMKRALGGEAVSDVGTFGGVAFETWYQPLRDARGRVAGMVGVAVDVTDRARAEREREEARERAEVLAVLGDALQAAVAPDEAAGLALERLGPALHATAMLVVPVDGHDVRTPVVWGDPPRAIGDLFARDGLTLADTPVLQRSASTARAAYLDDYASEPGAVSGVLGVACGVEPILSRDARVVGFLVVWRGPRDGGWTDGERDLVRRAASTVGLALERADATTRLRDQRDALREANASLLRSNAELERFAYVASHDLQEPLRTIASFTEILNRRYGDVLDEPGRKYLGLVTRGAERMKTMIDDLLVFSRLNAVREPPRPVNATAALEEALGRLHASLERTGARVEHGPLPTVESDEGELTQLLQNLLGNAVKFHREGVAPHVRIDATLEDDGLWHFTVRDNGIGIDAKYQERVFGLFQRLHVRDKYEGTGLGLAIVRKIVERHGGRVWLDSEVGVGTTVHFTLRGAPTTPAV